MKIKPLSELQGFIDDLNTCNLSSIPGPLVVIVAEPNPLLRGYKRVTVLPSGNKSNHIIIARFNCPVNEIPLSEIRGRSILAAFSDEQPDENRMTSLKFANKTTEYFMAEHLKD